MKLQKLYSKVRQALDDYNMITENDKIAIGVSGGKDSLTLLYALSGIRSFYPVPFELVAIAVDLGYEGQFYSFAPVTQLDGSGLTIIRPLMYVGESDVKGFKNKYNLPVCKNPCPYDGHTRREYVKQLVRQLNMENPGVKKRLFSAIQNGNIDDWMKCTKPSDAS